LFVHTLPVIYERPELVTAPSEEKRTKSAATPKLGACAKCIPGIKTSISANNKLRKVMFTIFYPLRYINAENKFSKHHEGTSLISTKCYTIVLMCYMIYT